MSDPRSGKVVIITGAAVGIGRAAALRFVAEGARPDRCLNHIPGDTAWT